MIKTDVTFDKCKREHSVSKTVGTIMKYLCMRDLNKSLTSMRKKRTCIKRIKMQQRSLTYMYIVNGKYNFFVLYKHF